jgi:H+/Cl- antiporter ClcA
MRETHATRLPSARIVALSLLLAACGTLAAMTLKALIFGVTQLAFYGRMSLSPTTPWEHHLGAWVVVVPVIGGLIVGAMAKWGSPAIRGHGIPEAMERVLKHESRIPARVGVLKPLSAAIAIGTGGPFGAEGPIIATGSALGSWVGQRLHTTSRERKTLLAAGAAAGMTATFGSPVSAVLLAIELLLFELSAATVIPVAIACAFAASLREAWIGSIIELDPGVIAPAHPAAMVAYAAFGIAFGVLAVALTHAVHGVEHLFEKAPVHWAWWPAIGGLAVGLIGVVAPRTLGVGYDNIRETLRGDLVGHTLLVLAIAKAASWAIALGSGTSGGTLAPLFTMGSALGALVGGATAAAFPSLGVDPRLAAVVGMAATFAGASRALLASVVFAFETTRQPATLAPLLAGCSVAYLVSVRLMPESIMTHKLAQRGTHVPTTLHPPSHEATPAPTHDTMVGSAS